MIAFLKDWDTDPRPGLQLTTKNKSFVDLAAKLRSMGIKNHLFLLALYDQTLSNVDPHDPELTDQLKLRVLAECKRNIWYFFREVLRIPQKGGAVTHFRAHRSNIAVIWCVVTAVMVYVEQIRQSGKTTTVGGIVNYILNIYGKNSSINWLTRDDSLRVKTMGDIKGMMDELPDYCILKLSGDKSNTSELEVSVLDNTLKMHVPSKSVKDADKIGRGFTSEWSIVDEGAYISNIAVTLPVLLSAGTAARDSVRAIGKMFGTILMSTAGKLHDPDGRYAYDITQTSCRFRESLYDCRDQEELHRQIAAEARGNIRVFISFNHRQLGYTDEWLRRAISETMSTKETANRDFFNIWETGTTSHPLDKDVLQKIVHGVVEPTFVHTGMQGYTLRWYIPQASISRELSLAPHIIGLDSSEGIGADDYGLTITNGITGAVVAAGEYNHVDTLKFSPWIAELLIQHPTMVLNIERKSTGVVILKAIIDILVANGIDPFKRIYNRIVNDPHDFPNEWEVVRSHMRSRPKDFYSKTLKYFGFVTAGSGFMSRDALYGEVFAVATEEYGSLIKDSKVVGQIEGLVTKNNRIDHGANGHDDLVIAYLLSMWFLMRASNLKHYGINPLSVLSRPSSTDKTDNTSSQVSRIIETQLENAVEQFKNQTNPLLKQLIKQRINKLAEAVSKGNSNPRNLEALLASLDE